MTNSTLDYALMAFDSYFRGFSRISIILRLWAAFSQQVPVYVRELDEFIVFVSLSTGPKTLDEPVVRGWKE